MHMQHTHSYTVNWTHGQIYILMIDIIIAGCTLPQIIAAL